MAKPDEEVVLHRAFRCTHKIEYLNEAISTNRDGINTANSFHSRVTLLTVLISLLSTHLRLLRHEEDLREVMQLFPTVVDYRHASLYDRLPISLGWATIALSFGQPSASTAYDHAMLSM